LTLYPAPPIPVFPAGYAPLPADMDSWIQYPLGFCTQRVVFRAQQTTHQNLVDGALYNGPVVFDDILEDPFYGYPTGGGWNPAANQWMAPFTGWYAVTISVSVQAASGMLGAVVNLANTQQYVLSQIQVSSATVGAATGSVILPMTGGVDYVYAEAYWASLPSGNNQYTDCSLPGRYPAMEIMLVAADGGAPAAVTPPTVNPDDILDENGNMILDEAGGDVEDEGGKG